MLIDGQLVAATEGTTFESVSPRDGRVVARMSLAGESDARRAAAAARRAFDNGPWPRAAAKDRAAALRRIAALLERHADEFAFLEAVDSGKPVSNVLRSDIAVSLDSLDYFAGSARAATASSAEMPDPQLVHHGLREPLGVVLEILPWNGPLWTGVQRLAAILISGNVAVVKPASVASLTFLRLGQLLAQADLPPGVVNIVTGPGRTVGRQLVTDVDVDLVSLTGSVQSGAEVLGLAAPSITRVVLELGGKNPAIVAADADLEAAVRWVAIGALANGGQVCTCASRILVQRSIYEPFLAGLVERIGAIRVGDPLEAATEMGPLVSAEHAASVRGYIEAGRAEARLVLGGTPYDDPVRSAGAYVRPTVFANAAPDCRIAREEIFGPVVTVIQFDDAEEAIRIANDTAYGLSAGVFTSNLDTAWSISRRLRAGQVYVNRWFAPGMLEAPSQGYRQSGYGTIAPERYTQRKNLFIGLH